MPNEIRINYANEGVIIHQIENDQIIATTNPLGATEHWVFEEE